MSRYSLSFATLPSLPVARLAPCTPTVTEPNTAMSSLPSAASAPAAAKRFATSMGISLDFISGLLAQEELAAHRRGIVAVDVRVAVQAGARNEPRAGRACRRAAEALIAAVVRAGVARPVVAVLAEIRRALVEELRVDRSVRVVAGQAVLLDRRVLVHEGAALVGVAAGAQLIHRLLLDHGVAQGTMGVVAAGALELPLDDRMVRGLQELRADLLVADRAGLVLQLPVRRHVRRDRGILLLQLSIGGLLRVVNAVAVVAGDLVFLVTSGFPECEVAVSAVAFQARAAAHVRGRRRVLCEIAIRLHARRLLGVGFALAVAARASGRAGVGGHSVPGLADRQDFGIVVATRAFRVAPENEIPLRRLFRLLRHGALHGDADCETRGQASHRRGNKVFPAFHHGPFPREIAAMSVFRITA